MRLFELATELKTTEHELFRQARKLLPDIRSGVSSLDDDEAATLRKGFVNRLDADVVRDDAAMAARLAEKATAAAAILSSIVSADAAALDESRRRAESYLGASAPSLEDVAPAAPAAPVAATPTATPTPAPATEPKPTPAPAPAAPAVPAGPRAAERAIGGIAPLPVRRAVAPRPELTIRPRVPVRKPVNPDPADGRAASLNAKGGLAGAGGVSRISKKIAGDTEEARDLQNERRREQRDQRKQERAREAAAEAAAAGKTIVLRGNIVVKDLAEKLGLRPNQVITELLKRGVLASINQSVDAETAEKLAAAHGFAVEHEKRRNAAAKPVFKNPAEDDDIPEDRPDQLQPRPPVVTFLGHVDHGKTTLMDCIRKAHVAAGEAGGITQAISAYTVDVSGRKITFLDTPGHAAFSAMRVRGASLTDVAVIIVAADDGIMPQTKEAIKAARDAHVTIMVAITKCDKPTANPMRVMQQLQAESLTPEEWGGSTVVCQVSGTTGDGVGNLLDMILLQADVLELSANPDRRANGTVIEASMAPGCGPVVNVLVTGGTLSVGDVMLCGEFYGKVRALTDSTGKRLKSAGPSQAVSVMGLSGVPDAGAEFRVMKNDKRARELAEKAAERRKEEMLGGVTQARSADEIFKRFQAADMLTLDLILRADVQGSVEAIADSIREIKSSKVSCNIIQSGTGAIAVNDVERAGHGKAVIIGFNVSPESGVNALARHDGVRIQTFRIIYELLDFVKQEMLALLPVEMKEVVRGHATVKQVFDLGKEGVVAGSLVEDGFITTKGQIRVMRRGKLVHTGAIETIRHFKETVTEVKQAQECGILLSGWRDFEEGDTLECFAFEELPKTL